MTVTDLRPPCPTRAAMTEMWRPVEGHPYEVSWDGRVRNTRTGAILKPQPCRIKDGVARYHKVNLGRGVQVQVHQLVAEAWHPRPVTGFPLVVDHRDNDGTRNVATNLRWLTKSMNTRQWYAMNAACEASGRSHGMHLQVGVPDEEWASEFERLKAAGL